MSDSDPALLSDEPFDAEVTIRFLPGVKITFSTRAAPQTACSYAFLAGGADDLTLNICMGDHWTTHRQGGARIDGDGAVPVPDTTVASALCPSLSHHICIRLTRHAPTPAMSDFGDTLIRPVALDSEALQLLLGYAQTLVVNRPLNPPALREMAARHIRDLIVMVLRACDENVANGAKASVRTARRQVIKADIDRHVTEPGLSVTSVAARHGISPRYLQALFEDEDTTFSGFVLERRLVRAHHLLASPRHGKRRIADIAFAVGFGDLSHFNHAFRRRYGVRPSDVRARALAGHWASS